MSAVLRTLTDSLGEYNRRVPPPPGWGGSPRFNFSFDLQEFPQLQTEAYWSYTRECVQCDRVWLDAAAALLTGALKVATDLRWIAPSILSVGLPAQK